MRSVRLLFVLALALITATNVFAQDSKADNQKPLAQNEAKPVPPLVITSEANPSGSMPSYEFKINGVPFRIQARTDPKMQLKMQQMMQDFAAQMNGCYVMHTIQVARDSKDSDSTHIVDVTNCTPAKRFEMKSAVATPQSNK